MEQKINAILFTCLIIIGFTYFVFIFSGTLIPALEPFSIAVAMLCLMYERKKLYKAGKINKINLNVIFYAGLFTVHIFIVGGFMQIYRAFIK